MGISPERGIEMKKILSLAIAAVVSVFMAGCSCGKSECKKDEVKQPKQECKCACQEKGCCACKKAAAKPAAKKAPAKAKKTEAK